MAAAAREGGPPLIDLGRGNPEVGPPPHVVEALAGSAARADVHGYSPIRGLLATKEAIAARYRDVYGVELDPEREVALVPGTKTAIVELALALADDGDTILLPDPYYPDYPSGVALAGARLGTVPLDPDAGFAPDLDAAPAAAALYLNYPSNPCAVCAPPGTFEAAVAWAARTGGAVVHDAAYVDLVFDGRTPRSFLATAGSEGRRRRDVVDVEDLRDGRLAHRVRRRQRRDRRARQPAQRPRARRHLRAAAARGDRRARRPAGLGRGARRRLRAAA